MVLKIKDKEFTIKYGTEATSKSGIFAKMVKVEASMEKGGEDSLEKFDEFVRVVAELLLIGLQNKHKNEFGYDYDTLDEKDKQLSKVFDLLDEYLEDEDTDCFELYGQLEKELEKNGFLRSLFKKMKEATEKENKKQKKSKLEVVAES